MTEFDRGAESAELLSTASFLLQLAAETLLPSAPSSSPSLASSSNSSSSYSSKSSSPYVSHMDFDFSSCSLELLLLSLLPGEMPILTIGDDGFRSEAGLARLMACPPLSPTLDVLTTTDSLLLASTLLLSSFMVPPSAASSSCNATEAQLDTLGDPILIDISTVFSGSDAFDAIALSEPLPCD